MVARKKGGRKVEMDDPLESCFVKRSGRRKTGLDDDQMQDVPGRRSNFASGTGSAARACSKGKPAKRADYFDGPLIQGNKLLVRLRGLSAKRLHLFGNKESQRTDFNKMNDTENATYVPLLRRFSAG